MNGWWFAAGCAGLYVIFALFTWRSNKRQVMAFAASRTSPDREEFIELLADDCERDIAGFVWKIFVEEYSGWGVDLTPHPDDDYLQDMPIDPENQDDWFGDFCVANDLRPGDFPQWPEGAATTVQNFARWLSEGRRSSTAAAA